MFTGVRLRTHVAKRLRTQETALSLVFKLIERLSQRWHALNAPEQVALVASGRRFTNGELQPEEEAQQAA